MDQQLNSLLASSGRVSITGLRGAAHGVIASAVANSNPLCCIVADEHQVQILEQDIRLFTKRNVLQYPGHEIPPYTPLSPDQQITATRLSSLYRFKEGSGTILITSIEALLRRIMPSTLLTSTAEYIEAGEDCDQDDLIRNLDYLGYENA